jgi:hypothetical protein
VTVETGGIIVSSILLPFIVSLIKSADWQRQIKFVVALVVALALGAISAWVGGAIEPNLSSVLKDSVAIFAGSQSFYILILKGSGLDATLTAFGSEPK